MIGREVSRLLASIFAFVGDSLLPLFDELSSWVSVSTLVDALDGLETFAVLARLNSDRIDRPILLDCGALGFCSDTVCPVKSPALLTDEERSRTKESLMGGGDRNSAGATAGAVDTLR